MPTRPAKSEPARTVSIDADTQRRQPGSLISTLLRPSDEEVPGTGGVSSGPGTQEKEGEEQDKDEAAS
eukprot:12358162-Alexandrium_andersonii.AAC.1